MEALIKVRAGWAMPDGRHYEAEDLRAALARIDDLAQRANLATEAEVDRLKGRLGRVLLEAAAANGELAKAAEEVAAANARADEIQRVMDLRLQAEAANREEWKKAAEEAESKVAALKRERVSLWTCPDCAFSFDAAHKDEDGGYSCPVCGEARAERRLGAVLALCEDRERIGRLVHDGWRAKLTTRGTVSWESLTEAQKESLMTALDEIRKEVERVMGGATK